MNKSIVVLVCFSLIGCASGNQYAGGDFPPQYAPPDLPDSPPQYAPPGQHYVQPQQPPQYVPQEPPQNIVPPPQYPPQYIPPAQPMPQQPPQVQAQGGGIDMGNIITSLVAGFAGGMGSQMMMPRQQPQVAGYSQQYRPHYQRAYMPPRDGYAGWSRGGHGYHR